MQKEMFGMQITNTYTRALACQIYGYLWQSGMTGSLLFERIARSVSAVFCGLKYVMIVLPLEPSRA